MVQGKSFSTIIHYISSDLERAPWIRKETNVCHVWLSRSRHFIVFVRTLFSLIPCSRVITASISPLAEDSSWGLANEKCCNSRNASPLAAVICFSLAVKQILIFEDLIYWLKFWMLTFFSLSYGCKLIIHVIHSYSKNVILFFVAKVFFLFTFQLRNRSFFTMASCFSWFA